MPPMDTLVHISAPTSKQHDDKFMKQAMAYSGFLPIQRHDILTSPAPPPEQPIFDKMGVTHRINSVEKTVESLEHRGPTPMVARKTISQRSSLHRSRAENPVNARWADAVRSRIPIAQGGIDIPAALKTVRGDNTKHIFDTQHAATGVESQISIPSDLENVPISSTEFARSSKKRRRSLSERSNATQSWIGKSPKVMKEASNNSSFHSINMSQDRRDSQSPEVQLPMASPDHGELLLTLVPVKPQATTDEKKLVETSQSRAMSPSTTIEQERAAFQALRQLEPKLFLDGLNGCEEIVSTILPGPYGLSKSNIGSRHQFTDDESDSRFRRLAQLELDQAIDNRNEITEDALSVQNQSQLNRRSVHLDRSAQKYNDEEVIATTEKTIALHELELQGSVNPQRSHAFARSKDTAFDELPHKGYHSSPFERNGGIVAESPSNSAGKSAVTARTQNFDYSDASIRRNAAMSLRVPKPTKLPPATTHRSQRTPSPAWSDDAPVASKSATHLEERPKAVQPDLTVFDALKAMPQQIFPEPEPEAVDTDDATAQDTPNSRTQAAMLMEKHILYRRQMHRNLSPIERGYWTFSIKSWTPRFQLQFLDDLRVYLEKRTSGQSPWAEIHFDASGLPDQVDVYCGAAEVGNVWLFLHVLSERKLAQQDLHWIDWEGKVAVTMPAKVGRGIAGAD